MPAAMRCATAGNASSAWRAPSQINRQERQRLEFLLDRGLVFGLNGEELAELAYLQYLNGTGPAAPPVKIKDAAPRRPRRPATAWPPARRNTGGSELAPGNTARADRRCWTRWR
jgi:hypothetical protein